MKKEIWIYIEGAEKGPAANRLRTGFRAFLAPLYELAQQKGIKFHPPIMCGSGVEAYKDFQTGLRSNKHAINILLVDSEKPVSENAGAWAHLNWDSLGLDDSHCHLMAQTMEAWLIADKSALADFYQQGFSPNALPQNPRVEEIPKADLLSGLHRATEKTSKGRYHKTIHAPEILKRLDVAKVRQAAWYCDRLFQTLTEKMN
ncbi:MAG: DUF4276 family protein [Acidobacteria bacterium]|nr:DUF4276 family protein [Acidobacteriota bacterium]